VSATKDIPYGVQLRWLYNKDFLQVSVTPQGSPTATKAHEKSNRTGLLRKQSMHPYSQE
jgi:hypothetical protein